MLLPSLPVPDEARDNRAAGAHGGSAAAITEDATQSATCDGSSQRCFSGCTGLARGVGESATFGQLFFIGHLIHPLGICHHPLFGIALTARQHAERDCRHDE